MNISSIIEFAWNNTTDQWQRLLVRCLGIAFAVVLMFMQTGFRNALFDSNVRVMQEKIEADIVIRSEARYMFSARQLISRDDVIAARSCPGVKSAQPIYLENAISELRCDGCPARRVRVLAFDPLSPSFASFELEGVASKLRERGMGAGDVKSKSFFKFPKSVGEESTNQYELAGKTIKLAGFFELGIDFSNDGNLVMTPANFAYYFPLRGEGDPLSVVDYGVIGCQENANTTEVISRLQTLLGSHLIVETKDDFIRSDRKFWNTNTPIGLVFWFGTILGFIVGMSICYQVFATDIRDHLSEFSTLKAMGYGPPFFVAVIVVQAALLSVVAFGPGLLASLLLFQVTNWGTGLELFLNVPRTSLIFGLTLLMCILSGLLALRKLLVADPASLFK